MTVFDMAKHLPESNRWDAMIVGRESWDRLKELPEPQAGFQPNSYLGIPVEVVNDPQERKVMAVTRSMMTGQPVLFEGKDGNWHIVEMPKADPMFPQVLWSKGALYGKTDGFRDGGNP